MGTWPVVFLFAGAALGAADWPQWRGPARDGRAELPAIARWPKALTRAWKAPVGLGHASPVVAGDRVYVFAREGQEEVASAFDLASGRRLWRQAYAAPYTMNSAAVSHGPGPKATPVVAGGRLYTFGISGIASCFDAGTGALVWQRTFKEHRAGAPDYGAASSPVVDAGRLVLNVGGPADGSLQSLDAATGATRWAWKGDGPGYASPIVATLDGVRQLVVETQGEIAGVDVASGAPLWTIPLRTPYDQNAITAVVAGGVVVYSGLDQGVRAVRPRRQGARWTAEEVWKNDEVSLYMSVPVLDGTRLFAFSHKKKGEFVCLDAATGRLLWRSEGRQGENAALVAVGRHLLALKDDAELLVLDLDAAAFKPVATYTVADGATWAQPVPTARGLLVKDVDSLALLRLE
ncbi:MAG: PQQ-binding-like beta-propeller repeat protein [Vicinamibacteria bacterium]